MPNHPLIKSAPFCNYKWRTVQVGSREVVAPEGWSEQAVGIVTGQYLAEDEHVPDLLQRVLLTISLTGEKSGHVPDAQTFYYDLVNIVIHQQAAFNSPVWYNVGRRENPQCSACFINAVEDTMESIMDLAKLEAQLFKWGSGSGTNFSTLRGSCEQLSNGGKASGPVSFMRGFDAFAGVIKSGGKTRRAAKMVILDVDHPDIEEFIWCKVLEERKAKALAVAGYPTTVGAPSVFFQNANNSVRVSDAFMRSVAASDAWQTIERKTGHVAKDLRAADLLTQMAQAAWECGDPAIQFDDTINKWNTCAESGRINASNPCVTGDTMIETDKGVRRIDEFPLYGEMAFGADGRLHVVMAACTGRKPVYELVAVGDGEKIYRLKATLDHRILCTRGDISLQDLTPDDLVITWGEQIGFGWDRRYGTARVRTIRFVGVELVYDITEPETQHFVANGIIVHNCSEFMFLDDSACNLASINLVPFLSADGAFHIKGFVHVVNAMITAQDILVDLAGYPTGKISHNSRKYRPLGLGYTNLGAALMRLGLPYDSPEAREWAAYVTALMTGAAYAQSTRLGTALGTFDPKSVNAEHCRAVIAAHRRSLRAMVNGDESLDDVAAINTPIGNAAWAEWCHVDAGRLRNAQVTLLAPTGTISFMMDCDTTGIEPAMALVHTKKLADGRELKMVNRSVEPALLALGYGPDRARGLRNQLAARDAPTASAIKPEHVSVFDCALPDADGRCISVSGHLDMMAAVQPFLSGSISKTVNMPSSATVEDIRDVFQNAWLFGLKSVAIYRDGSKAVQPITTTATAPAQAPVVITAPASSRCKMPKTRRSLTHKFSISGHKGYLTVGLYDDGRPGEVFLHMAKAGSLLSGMADAWAVALSFGLQYGVPLEAFVKKFAYTHFEPAGLTGDEQVRTASSVVDYVARWLEARFLTTEKPVSDPVPVLPPLSETRWCLECGAEMVRTGICWSCPTCGTTTGCG